MKQDKWDKLNKELDDALDAEFGSEEPKQETLEEGFDRIYNSMDFTEFDFASFKLGAKWQQERMYSEEDLKEAFKQVRYCIIFEDTQFEDWLEKFKKK